MNSRTSRADSVCANSSHAGGQTGQMGCMYGETRGPRTVNSAGWMSMLGSPKHLGDMGPGSGSVPKKLHHLGKTFHLCGQAFHM